MFHINIYRTSSEVLVENSPANCAYGPSELRARVSERQASGSGILIKIIPLNLQVAKGPGLWVDTQDGG